jgi:hypothetical protein
MNDDNATWLELSLFIGLACGLAALVFFCAAQG